MIRLYESTMEWRRRLGNERLKLKKQLVLLRRRGRKILLFRSKQEPPRAQSSLKIPKNLFSTRSIEQYCFFVLSFSLARTRVYFSLRFITSFNCQAKSIGPSGGADSVGHFLQGEKKNLNRFNSFRLRVMHGFSRAFGKSYVVKNT